MKRTHGTAAPIEIALASAETGGGPPAWVHLMPLGTWHGVDGRGPYINDRANAALVVAATAAIGKPLAVDYDHAMDLPLGAKAGAAAPAAGWIEQVELRSDGIWGRVEWTTNGGTAVASREYRFISPVFDHDKAGRVVRIRRAGLTNGPNFPTLTALAAEQNQEEGTDTMDLLQTLITLLGLAAGATAEDVVAAVKALMTEDKAEGEAVATAAAAMGLPANATLNALLAAIAAQPKGNDLQTAVASLNATVTKQATTIAELNKNLTHLQATQGAAAAETAVASAMAAGKVAPAAKNWALDYAKTNPAGFAAYVAAMPAVLTPGTDLPAVASAQGGNALSAEETAVASQLGMTTEQFTKAKAKKA